MCGATGDDLIARVTQLEYDKGVLITDLYGMTQNYDVCVEQRTACQTTLDNLPLPAIDYDADNWITWNDMYHWDQAGYSEMGRMVEDEIQDQWHGAAPGSMTHGNSADGFRTAHPGIQDLALLERQTPGITQTYLDNYNIPPEDLFDPDYRRATMDHILWNPDFVAMYERGGEIKDGPLGIKKDTLPPRSGRTTPKPFKRGRY